LIYGKSKPSFDGGNAYNYIVRQCSFGPRNPGSQGHRLCKEFLINELKKSADNVTEQKFYHFDENIKKNVQMANIIASFNVSSKKRIMLCAHWDTRPFADRDKNPIKRKQPILGANDGASGVAVLLEIAKILKTNKPNVGIDIVLFDGEDYGHEGTDNYFLGSKYYVKNNSNYSPMFGILLDMVGDKDLEIPIEGHSKLYAPDIVNRVWDSAEKIGASAFIRNDGNEVKDDHLILLNAGIRCIDVIDFDYPYWHTTEDTPDKCSPESLQQIGDVLVEIIYSL
jgi:Zn-dependent M28 family amino/carboxypeptidase